MCVSLWQCRGQTWDIYVKTNKIIHWNNTSPNYEDWKALSEKETHMIVPGIKTEEWNISHSSS